MGQGFRPYPEGEEVFLVNLEASPRRPDEDRVLAESQPPASRHTLHMLPCSLQQSRLSFLWTPRLVGPQSAAQDGIDP